MANFKVIAVALVLVLGVGCKKKKTGDTTGDNKMGTNAGTGGSMSGTGAGTGGTMAGSGSDTMAGGSGSAAPEPPKAKELINWAAADIKWGPMDPANPDKSPQVAALWGDMTKEPNGWLIKLKGGTPGSHHTHTGTYYGVTIAGAPSHFMDGQKKGTPLPAGAFWTMPGGVAHTSQCLGKEDCIGLVQFADGKADFAPAEYKKDGKPDAGFKEILPKDFKFSPLDPKAPKDKIPHVAPAWGDNASGPSGSMIKIAAGFTSPPHTHSADYHSVVIKGTVMNYKPDDKAPKEMGPGSYFFQPGGVDHITACKAGKDECLAYVYFTGKFDFTPSAGAGGDAGSGSAAPAGSGDMKKDGGDMKKDGGDMKKDGKK